MNGQRKRIPSPHKTLRERAEEELHGSSTDIKSMTAERMQRLVQELQIHQMELEIQNQELREVQFELAESRDRYLDLYDFAPVGYVTLDQTGTIRECNLLASVMLGRDRRQLLGTDIAKLISLESRDIWSSHLHRMSNDDRKENYEIEMMKPDAARLPVRVEGVGFGAGENRRYLLALIDISERRAAETERDLLLQRERAAREEAQAANSAKDRFLAIVSHELRTPLTAVIGWSNLLRREEIDPSTLDRAVESIERNAKFQAQLIEDLLDMSAMIAGKISLSLQPIELTPLINTAIEMVRFGAEAKGIQIQTQFDTNLEKCWGDPKRMQQVIWNLLSNAVKFTPDGGLISVGLQQQGSEIRLTVTDTGIGIRQEFLPHVFEAFQQADSSSSRQHGGLGLGLAIVRHIVELHGGKVYAASAGVGNGSTFTIRLPIITD